MTDLAPGTTIRMRTPSPSVTPVYHSKGDKGDAGETGAPGGSDASFAAWIEDPASETRGALSATYGFFTNVKAHGAVGDGVADDTAAIQAAHDATLAGGVVFLPPGDYKTSAPIIWRRRVNLHGAGRDASTIWPTGDVQSCIKQITNYTAADPLTDVTFTDFKIDGTNQTASGGYTSAYKGFYMTYLKRVQFRSVYVYNTVASGFGTDFMSDCSFTDCIAESCGRLNDGTQPGGAGFGIGTGATTDEAVRHRQLRGPQQQAARRLLRAPDGQ